MMKLFIAIAILTNLLSCSTVYKNQNLEGKFFPLVQGEALDEKLWKLPRDFKSDRTILLIGYKQDSQFDIDRWLIGLDMKQIKLPTYEVPTIRGLFPRMFSTKINEGMRSGIPKKLWKGVITIYKDGETVQKFTGTEKPNNARVILLGEKGEILFFHDTGFSVEALNLLINKSK